VECNNKRPQKRYTLALCFVNGQGPPGKGNVIVNLSSWNPFKKGADQKIPPHPLAKEPPPAFSKGGNLMSPFVKGDLEGFSYSHSI
jgi:hypothetical protein